MNKKWLVFALISVLFQPFAFGAVFNEAFIPEGNRQSGMVLPPKYNLEESLIYLQKKAPFISATPFLLKGVYERISVNKVKQILDTYKDIPGSTFFKSVPMSSIDIGVVGDPVGGTAQGDSEKKLILLPQVSESVPEAQKEFVLKGSYEKVSTQQVQSILETYKDIPGGITLEGQLAGLGKIDSIHFSPTSNELIVNNIDHLVLPLQRSEVLPIFKALSENALLGVSLGDPEVVYGKLPKDSPMAIDMKIADHFFGSIVFANEVWVSKHAFPGNYTPKRNKEKPGYYAVYFNFKDFDLRKEGGTYKWKEGTMIATLIPLVENNETLKLEPDWEAIAQGDVPEAYEKNIDHLISHLSLYQKDSRVEKVAQYGMVAALGRYLLDQGIDLSKLK